MNENDVSNMPAREKFLRKHGFRRVWLDDRSGWWMQRDFPRHPYLKKLHLSIEEDISLYAWDVDCGSFAMVYNCKYNPDKLKKLIKRLEDDTDTNTTGVRSKRGNG